MHAYLAQASSRELPQCQSNASGDYSVSVATLMILGRMTILPLVALLSLPMAVWSRCACKFHGTLLSNAIYDNYPIKDPVSCTVGTDCKKYPGMLSGDSWKP